jgi:hypothetical protein
VLRHSSSDEENPDVIDVTDTYEAEDNTRFFAEATRELGGPVALIGLVGSSDLPGVALRRAQSILRWDRRPSLWSHVFLLVDDGVREVTLHSRAGCFPEPADNAITKATLAHYAKDPNVALLKVSMSEEEAARVAERATTRPNLERLRYDLFETLGFWQAFLWTRGTANPLEQGVPMAASALIEYCFEAIQLDLTPGANDRNSAPEHLWNSARWWTDAFGEFGRSLSGRAVIRDRHCRVLGPGEQSWK